MEQLKHECGVAMIRLLKPLEYYEKKYGTWMYGLNKLYLLMEKQHNRGQEGAGLASFEPSGNVIFAFCPFSTATIMSIGSRCLSIA